VVRSDIEEEAPEDGAEERVEKRHLKPNHDRGKERTKATVKGKRKRTPLEEEEADCSEYEPSADEKINDNEDDEDYMVKAPRQKESTSNKRRRKSASTNGDSGLVERRKRWSADQDEEEEEEPPTKKRNWTESEDELLIEAVDDHSARGAIAWVRVASQIRRQRTPRYRPTAVPNSPCLPMADSARTCAVGVKGDGNRSGRSPASTTRRRRGRRERYLLNRFYIFAGVDLTGSMDEQKMVADSRVRPWAPTEEDKLWRVSQKRDLKYDSRT